MPRGEGGFARAVLRDRYAQTAKPPPASSAESSTGKRFNYFFKIKIQVLLSWDLSGFFMKRILATAISSLLVSGCASTGDLAKTLRYANNDPVGIEHIKFQEINAMKRGTACTWNLFYFIPLFGDGSVITAADNGRINTVDLIGETGRWYFPFSKNCTVVFGDRAKK